MTLSRASLFGLMWLTVPLWSPFWILYLLVKPLFGSKL